MRTVAVILDAKIDAFVGKMAQAGKAAVSIGDAAKGAGKGAQREFEVLKDTAVQNEQSWNQVSKTIGAVGVAAGAVAGLAVREFSKFDAAMSGVASTGADAKASIDALRDAAIQQGADTAYSATEAAQGIEELARAGVTAEEILGGGLAGALSLAAAGQIGVADAAGIASTAMTQFKLSGEQIPHLADLLAAGAGKAMGGVDDLGMALKQSGLVASQFGLDIEETVGGLSAFAAAGLLGSDAGTSLKTMLLKLAKPSKEAQTLMDDLGISAYDAQGQFVGLEGLAGQLSEKMGGLTDAQRQSALATIFGTDAIRAASVLYENGAEGIAEWTNAVNDSGYAAETAAELQNNLIGDLEKLGGAWSTLAIQMGGSVDGPLRGAVQALEALVDAAGKTPGAASSLMAVTVAVAALGIGGAGLMKGISGIAQYQTALATLASSSPGIAKTATALTNVGKAAGGAALVIGGLSIIGAIRDQFREVLPDIEKVTGVLDRLANGKPVSMDSLFQGLNGDDIAMNVGSVNDAYDKLFGDMNRWQTATYNFDEMFSDLTGSASGVDITREALANLDDVLQGMDPEAAADAFAPLAERFKEQGASAEELIEMFPRYAAAAKSALQDAMIPNGPEQIAALMMGDFPAGMRMSAEAMAEFAATQAEAAGGAQVMADAVQSDVDAMQGVLDAAQGAADAIQSLNDSQRDAANLFMGAQAAGDKYIATLQGLKDQIKDNGKSTDEMTEKGRSNREYLRGLATDGRAATDAMIANGDGIDAANAKMAEQRTALLGVLGKFGIVGAEAQAYADDLGAIPNYVETLIATPGAKLSIDEADRLNASLEGMPDDVKTQIILTAQTQGYNTAMSLLNSLPASKTITVRINTVGGGGLGVGSFFKRAQGGPIYGPGTPTSDSIPIMASDGEFMMRTWAVNKIGPHRMAYMNATGKIPHFNTGGQVTPNGPATIGAYTAGTVQSGTPGPSITYVNVEGREAYTLLADQLRYADRLHYQTNGVHRGNN